VGCLTQFMRIAIIGPLRTSLGLQTREPAGWSAFFFLILMIKLSMLKLKNFKKFTKLSKDFGKLDDKLIIQHFHHIHIYTMTYTMYKHIKKYIIFVFSSYTRI